MASTYNTGQTKRLVINTLSKEQEKELIEETGSKLLYLLDGLTHYQAVEALLKAQGYLETDMPIVFQIAPLESEPQ